MSERNKKIRAGSYERRIEFDRKLANVDQRTIPASLSSETPHQRWFGNEVLIHSTDAIDMTRAGDNGLPLLFNHDINQPIGRVHNVRLDSGRLVGDLKFSRNAKAEEVWNDVRDGMLDSMSIGYRINKWEEQDDSDEVRVTKWSIYEGSVVSIAADATVGINRSEDIEMSNEDGQQTNNAGAGDAGAGDVRRDFKLAESIGRKAAQAEERLRVRAIDAIFNDVDDDGKTLIPNTEMMRAIRVRAIDEGWDELKTRREVMAANPYDMPDLPDLSQGNNTRSVPQSGGGDSRKAARPATAGADQLDKFKEAVTAAILVKSSVDTSEETRKVMNESGLGGYNMTRLGQEYLHRSNRSDEARLGDMDMAGALLQRTSGPQTHSDFTSILANVATLSALKGWNETGATWQSWCNTGSLPDFKSATIAGLGAYPDLDQIPRSGGPYNYKGMDDQNETAQLVTYGALFGVSREAIVGDVLDEFTRVPMKMGNAAARKVNQLAYGVLTGNQTMTYDSTALFHADHANGVLSSGGAPDVAALNVAYAAMRKQKAPVATGETGNAYLNIRPGYIIVPAALEGTAWDLINSNYDPAGTTASKSRRDAPNRFYRSMEVVVDAVLDSSSATAWYLAAPQSAAIDTVTMFFLNGNSAPYIEETGNGTSDGRTFKVRIDAVARALDHRGVYKNVGA